MNFLSALSVGNIVTSGLALTTIQSVKTNTDNILSSIGSLDVEELNNVMESLTNVSDTLSGIDLSQLGDLASLKTDILGAGNVTVLDHVGRLQSSVSAVQSSVTGLQSSISVLGTGIFNSLSYYDTGVHSSISDIYSSLSEITTIVLENMGGIENIGNSSVYPLYVSSFSGFPNSVSELETIPYNLYAPGSALILNPSSDNLSISLGPCSGFSTYLGWDNIDSGSATVYNFSIFNVSTLYSISLYKGDGVLSSFIGSGMRQYANIRPSTFANVQAGVIKYQLLNPNGYFCFYKSDDFSPQFY
jgi:hypothetical protein